MEIEDHRLPRLPACQLCYTRKTKCDNVRPKCTPCMKSGNECLTLSLDGSEPYTRKYIEELEQQVQHLRAGLTESPPASASQENGHEQPTPSRKEESDRLPIKVAKPSTNFAEGEGLSFMRLLFTDSALRDSNSTLLQTLAKRSRRAEATIKPNALPDPQEAWSIFNKYLNASHLQNPFLFRRDVELTYEYVYHPETHPAGAPTAHNQFRAFMILAIGSVIPYRDGTHKGHPYGYFLAALQQLNTTANILSRGLESIQDLLLVGRFGIYHHIGTSVWELTQLCMRMCIEQGLYKLPATRISLREEQIRRRVFWECYMIDRYSSITLDRPFALPDREIRVPFPANASDEELEAAEGTYANLNAFSAAPRNSPAISDMSIFFQCLRLRQITSKIHAKFQHRASSDESARPPSSVTASGIVYTNLDQLLWDLDDWRNNVPVFPNPRCLYESQDWFDLLLMRERLLLVRKALDLVPKRNNIPPKDLLSLLLQYATAVIMIFSRLYQSKRITYTRSYFQLLFTAGLSVMYCISVVTDHNSPTIQNADEALCQGEKALKQMGGELPDAKSYVTVYETLHRNVCRKWSHFLPGRNLSSAIPSKRPSPNDGNTPDSGRRSSIPPQSRPPDDRSRLVSEQPHTRSFSSPTIEVHVNGPGGGIISPQMPAQHQHQQHLIPMGNNGSHTYGYWPLPTPYNPSPHQYHASPQNPTQNPGTTPVSFDVFHDELGQNLWNVEAGLGEYAYGDINAPALLDDLYFGQ